MVDGAARASEWLRHRLGLGLNLGLRQMLGLRRMLRLSLLGKALGSLPDQIDSLTEFEKFLVHDRQRHLKQALSAAVRSTTRVGRSGLFGEVGLWQPACRHATWRGRPGLGRCAALENGFDLCGQREILLQASADTDIIGSQTCFEVLEALASSEIDRIARSWSARAATNSASEASSG